MLTVYHRITMTKCHACGHIPSEIAMYFKHGGEHIFIDLCMSCALKLQMELNRVVEDVTNGN